jgi:hypothetical protein
MYQGPLLMNREKGNWEARIIELDNPNYAKVGAKMTDLEGCWITERGGESVIT